MFQRLGAVTEGLQVGMKIATLRLRRLLISFVDISFVE